VSLRGTEPELEALGAGLDTEVTMTPSDPAYELIPDPSHLGDAEHEAELVRFRGWDLCAGLIPKEELDLPEPVYFEANFATLESSDFPINDVCWPIVSSRLLAALKEAGDFRHRSIPVVMVDRAVPEEERFDERGRPQSGVVRAGFTAIQISEFSDAFDWERSKYEADDELPDEVYRIKRLVLKEVPLPPLFRLSARPRPLMVSAAGRAAIERAGVRGVSFVPLSQIF
jgi:hypothetical protein